MIQTTERTAAQRAGTAATPDFTGSTPADGYSTTGATADPSHPATPGYVERDDLGRKTPAQIEREIAATRGQMDTTIERLKNRLQPANLIDEVLASFGLTPADVDESATDTIQRFSRRAAAAVRDNPVPSALVAAAGLYKIFADEERSHHPREILVTEPAGYRKTYDPATGRMTYAPRVPAWSTHYVWDDDVHQETWSEAAHGKLDELKATLASTKHSAGDKLKSVSETLTSLSGSSADELHDQWDCLREVNGSFVDARTGEPYDDEYGQEFRHLLAAEHVRAGQLAIESDDEGWAEMADATLKEIGETVGNASASASERASSVAKSFGNLMSGCWDSTCRYTHTAAEKSAAAGRSTGTAIRDAASAAYGATARGAHAVADGTRSAGHAVGDGVSAAGHSIASGARHAGESMSEGLHSAGEYAADTGRRISRKTSVAANRAWHTTGDLYDDYPLALGAAAIGVGLLAGLLLPRTRFEDRTYGEKSDRLKRQAGELGEEAVEAGKRVAEKTGEAAMQKAREEGIAPDQVKAKAESLAHDARDQAESLVKEAKSKAHEVAQSVQKEATATVEEAAATAKSAAKTAHNKAEGADGHTPAGDIRMKVEEVVATAADTAKKTASKEAKKLKKS